MCERHVSLERTNGFSTGTTKTTASKRASMDGILKLSRGNEVPKVDKNWCTWPCSGDLHSGVPSAKQRIRKQPSTKVQNVKEPKSLGALLTRKIFRPNENPTVSYPAWEDEWAFFRERHEFEMKQMKQMYVDLQEICQELKKMGSRKEDASVSSSRRLPTESMDSKTDDSGSLPGQSKRSTLPNHALKTVEYPKPNRRAKSAPRSRVNWDTGLTKEKSIRVRKTFKTSWYCPTAGLFEETIQVERVYIRNFVKALIEYEENRFSTAQAVGFERKGNSLRAMIVRFLPNANFAKLGHLKYGIEAWLNRIVFKEFGQANVSKSEERVLDAQARLHDSWAEFQKLSLLDPIDAINPEEEFYCTEFHVFCNRKFHTLQKELKWQEEWPDSLVKDFLEAMKHVWRAHKLALAFDPIASLFLVKSTTQFDGKFMEPLETHMVSQTDSSSPCSPLVGFLVNPGFIILKRIIKCQVCIFVPG